MICRHNPRPDGRRYDSRLWRIHHARSAHSGDRPFRRCRPVWPGDVTRVPYWVYRDDELLKTEQRQVFEGAVWNYLCLETEIAQPGDWRGTVVGQMPVVVARAEDGSIAAFENRCAHRGALICLDNAGRGAKDFQCVYHAWRYDLRGNLKSVAFRRGVNGEGGMPEAFRLEDHGPRQLRTTTLCGLVFGTLHDDTPPIEDYIGADVLAQLKRVVADRQIEIIGRFTEVLPNNWKMYAENVRDSYHASLLHLFFATFKINRLSQGGGLIVSPNGGCSVSSTIAPDEADDKSYAGMRSVADDFKLEDPSLLMSWTSTRTGFASRSSRCFRTLSSRRHRTPWRCGSSRRPGSIAQTWNGSTSATPTIRPRCANAGYAT